MSPSREKAPAERKLGGISYAVHIKLSTSEAIRRFASRESPPVWSPEQRITANQFDKQKTTCWLGGGQLPTPTEGGDFLKRVMEVRRQGGHIKSVSKQVQGVG